MNYQLDWSVLFSGQPRLWLLDGLLGTIGLTLAASLLATLVALGVLFLRLLPGRTGNALAGGYVLLIRNSPLVLQYLLWYFAVLPLLPQAWRDWLNDGHTLWGLTLPAVEFWVAIWGLGLFGGAFIAEEWLSGIRSLPSGQFEAARSQGLGYWQQLRFVILPQALANRWQPVVGQYLNIMKNSPLAMVIAVAELCYRLGQIESYNLHAIEAYGLGVVIYLLLGLIYGQGLLALGWLWFAHRRPHVRR